MNILLSRIIFIGIAAVTAILSLYQTVTWYFTVIITAIFVILAFTKGTSEDNEILILASGELLVIAVATTSFWLGYIVQCAIIGAVMLDGKVPADTQDLKIFAFLCLAALICAIIIDRSNHMLLPFLTVTAIITGITITILGVQEMRDRRAYAGGK